MKKYMCVGNSKIQAEWLPRWYEVPFKECLFATEYVRKNLNKAAALLHDDTLILKTYIILKPRLDKNYDIKIAKTEHLLNGGNDGTGIYE
jgi:hypothetical protein